MDAQKRTTIQEETCQGIVYFGEPTISSIEFTESQLVLVVDGCPVSYPIPERLKPTLRIGKIALDDYRPRH